MTNNFDLRQFLSENKLTKASQVIKEERFSDYYESEASKEVGHALQKVVGATLDRNNVDAAVDAAIVKAEEETGTQVSPREKRVLKRQAHWIYTMNSEMERESVEVEDEEVLEEEKPSAGLSKAEKSAVVKKAKAGEDLGKKGPGFEKVAKAAEKEYGSKEAGEKVAAAAMWKNVKEGVELSAREQEIVRLVENALGIPSTLPVAEAPVVEDEIVEENPLPKYKNIDELMKNIEEGTNEAAHKYKMTRMKEIADALEAKVTNLEEGENAEHIDQKAVKAMKKDIMTLRKGVDKLEKEYEKKFAKKDTKKVAS